MFSKRVISLLVVLSMVSQAIVLTNTDNSSNFVEDSSPLEQVSEYGEARGGGGGGIELVWYNPDSSTLGSIVSMGDYVLYYEPHHEKGTELFRSNGTEDGTFLVKDINPGENSSNPSGMTKVNDFAYFTADDGTHGRELWRTDGTEDGTFMVKDINPDDDFDAYCFTALGDEVLFRADDGTHGEELWKSDGTANGTVLLKDINIGEGKSYIGCQYHRHTVLLGEGQGFVTFGNSVYFSANNGTWSDENRTGSEMWRSDGTSEGTYLIKDLNPGDSSGFQGHMQVLGNHLYFMGNDGGGNGSELWKTDGTADGTVMVKDIRPGSLGSQAARFQLVGDNLFFFANDGSVPGSYSYEVWKTDGTEEGTVKVISDVYPGTSSMPTAVGDIFYFQADDDSGNGLELWKSDGTEEGTAMVKNFRGAQDGCCGAYSYMVPTGDTLYFGAWNSSDGSSGDWRMHQTDGTSNGTFQVENAENIYWPTAVTYMGDTLIFRAYCYHRSSTHPDGACSGQNLHKIGNITPILPSYKLYKDVEMNPITFDYDGENATWQISPDLPSNLSLANGTITGTPDELSDLTSYTVYANASVTSTPPDSILYYNAGDDDDGDGFWEDIHGNDDYDIAITNLERVEATGNTDLTHAYRFDSSSDSAYIEDDFEDWTGDLTDDSISIEMWFKPSALSDNKILWESGGLDNGNSLVLMDDELTYRLKTSGDNAYVDISITISLDSEFHNAIVVLNKESQMAYLYYDGELKANASFSGNFDWAGNDNTGIGSEKTNVGGYTNSEQSNYFDGDTTFRGDIAIYRILEAALDSSEVEALYDQFTSYRFKETYKIWIQSVPYPDTDGDGVCDGTSAVSGICTAGPDAFPFDAAASVDTDGDGMPDTLNGNSTSEPPLVEDLDDDNDGLLDLDEIANGTEPLNPDTDGDGYCDGSGTAESCIAGDVFPLNENEWFDTDGDGTGNNADTDDDNDGLDDTTEASSDPATNTTNPDTDGDGVCDGSVNVTINDSQICIGGPDELPTDPDETIDTDGDGIGNNGDTDDDNDGLSDDEENDIGTDPLDPDTDGDFYCDGPIVVTGCAGSDDAFPLDDSEWLDTDGDGIGNNADPDDDGDSYTDIFENDNGYDPLDGCDPNLNSSTCDQDYDGLNNGEEIALGTNVTNPDTDGDEFCDGDLGVEGICVAGPDDFPLDPAAYLDTDGDGMPDTINGTSTSEPVLIEDLDDDNDGLLDLDEIANGTESLNPDSDGDGYCDGSVTVGSCIAGDVFPLDENEWFDTDGDEIGNNADPDDDNDGYNDTVEITEGSNPLDSESIPLDTDGDKIPDSTDTDDDNDGYNDTVDAFPTNVTEWLDNDGDEIGNNADTDDDGDGYNDTMELSEGSDPLDSESIPLDTDGDKIPDSTDTDDDNDGYNDTVDAFPTTSDEWLDTDDDGIGNNADTDDDGDTLSDAEEAEKGTNPLTVDTDADGIPDNFDPSPTDPNGDFDGDGKLDSEEYNPDADGNPADADGNGEDDMHQALALGSTNNSERSPAELCCLALLLLLLLLFPLGKKRYNNSLIYQPNDINYVIGDNESKIRAVPSLHEYTKKYLSLVNKDGLKNITYGISGDLNELEIDSKTGVISGHPENTGKYSYEITMKHSKGKYTGELIVNVTSKDEKVEKPEEPEASTPALSSNPEPENTSSKPKFKGGSGTKMDPFVITPAKGLAAGEQISSKQVIMISGLKPGGVVNMEDIDSSKNGKRFAIVSEPDEVDRQSALVADDDGKIKFRINFKDDEPSYDGADYEGLIKLGTASVYLSWAVEVIKEESEEVSEPEPVVEEPEEEAPLSKEEKKQKELERIKTRSEKIDFNVLGEATNSTLSKPVEMDANEIELEDASEFEKKGTATITDVDGSEIITWTSKKGNALFGIAGLTRAFVAASIVVAKDDLQVIKGIGPFIEEKLNALGIYMFVQIARMTPKLEEEVNVAIEFFPGRVKRDEWVKQANQLAK